MLKVRDYLDHAEECRRQAASTSYAHIRDQLLKMATAWEELAEQRRVILEKKENIGAG
jgi:hypothetical protein